MRRREAAAHLRTGRGADRVEGEGALADLEAPQLRRGQGGAVELDHRHVDGWGDQVVDADREERVEPARVGKVDGDDQVAIAPEIGLELQAIDAGG